MGIKRRRKRISEVKHQFSVTDKLESYLTSLTLSKILFSAFNSPFQCIAHPATPLKEICLNDKYIGS